ncbi:MAG TPA: hypothetical protein GX717_07100, partial [Clostridiaceae bacterium]|nr:hypothetical protein [Clostridiaceae bacterium]
MFEYNFDFDRRHRSRWRGWQRFGLAMLVVVLVIFLFKPLRPLHALDAFRVDSLHIDMVVRN